MDILKEKFSNITEEENEDGVTVEVPDVLNSEFSTLFSKTDDEIIQLLMDVGLLKNGVYCKTCGKFLKTLKFEINRQPFYKCYRKGCKSSRIPLFRNTIFNGTRLKLGKLLEILYQFSCRRTVGDTEETVGVNRETVISFYKLFRSSLSYFIKQNTKKIGGVGATVHVDETPMTRRHGETGRHFPSNTVWVVGCVDKVKRKCILRLLPSHSRTDLYAFIKEWVVDGTTIHTDVHRSYFTLDQVGYEHNVVNHSIGLVGTDGIHTNCIEGIFGGMKKIRRQYGSRWTNIDDLNDFLGEFCFRYAYKAYDRKKTILKRENIKIQGKLLKPKTFLPKKHKGNY